MNIPAELNGKNLGEKHQHFNKLVSEAVESETYNLNDFNVDEGDIKNLLKIDIACKQRNVDYIMKVLVCDDILYVSRAIKQCPWLVTDAEYSNIINPEYLRNTLFPHMNIKSINKITKHIQINLKDSTRAEQFYENENSPERAVNWLPQCSSEFILRNIAKHTGQLKISQIKRLCEKNISVLEIYDADRCLSTRKIFEATVSLLNSNNVDKYLDLVEKLKYVERPNFSKSATSLIMKLARKRIFDKFGFYCNLINIPTFIKFLESKNIKKFLLDQASKSEEKNEPLAIVDKHKLKYFLESMPTKERFDFVTQVFINKIHKQKTNLSSDSEIRAMSYLYNCVKNKQWFNELQLYQYAPFDIAFSHIKTLINAMPQNVDIKLMFSTVITSAKQNNQNIKLLLQYFQDNYSNGQYELRYHFINDIISETNFSKFDQSVWNIVEDIMMRDIVDSENDVQKYLEAITIYKVLHSECIPEIVEKKIQFNSLEVYKNKLNKEDKLVLFDYLYSRIESKLACSGWKTEEEFDETVTILNTFLNLLSDWKKNLRDYPLIINTIKEVIYVKKQNSWNRDLSFLYNKNKSWKKWLFEQSFDLNPSQPVFINAIKHDPTMFQRYKLESEETCLKEKESIIQFLRKIKIYWPQTLSKVWADFFLNNLNDLKNQLASSRGMCILLPRPELLAILTKYVPENPKIDYNNINELNLNLQRCFAKNMHIARPQPTPEIVLLYAKGDYLTYSLPSLLSIYHNINEAKSEKYISELLKKPVSLQKHAIRFAFIKMKSREIPACFAKVWTTSSNTTIRSVLFKTVFDLLCKEKDPQLIEALWNLLAMFMDNLTFNENKSIYDILLKVDKVPKPVVANFFVKSYTFLTNIRDYSDNLIYTLFPHARKIMENLSPKFVANKLLEFINSDFTKCNSRRMKQIVLVISAYLLYAKDEQTQMQKYEEIFIVIVNICSTYVKHSASNKLTCRNYSLKNFELLLDQLYEDVQFVYENELIFPIQMFLAINNKLIKLFPVKENYVLFTKWALALLFIKNLNREHGNNWNELCLAAAPHFGKQCHELLYEHCKKYFPRVYILFGRALQSVLNTFIKNTNNIARWKIYKCLLNNNDFVEAYLTVIKLFSQYLDDESIEQAELRKNILQHQSLEVKMHYYSKNILE